VFQNRLGLRRRPQFLYFSATYTSFQSGTPDPFKVGMNIWTMLLAAQILVTVFALVRESAKDARFEDDKLEYRS